MALIILGLIMWIAGIVIIKQKEELHKLGVGLRIGGLGLLVIGALTSCVKQIEAGQIGVKSLFGKVDDDVLHSGLNFVNPLVNVSTMDIKTQNYTMSGVHDEGEKGGDDAIRVLTADGLEVVLDLTVLYRVVGSEAPRLVKETGFDYKDKIVRPLARTKIRDNAVYYTAIDLYSTKRDQFSDAHFQQHRS
jgi:regulator of protease activity HflC (stomatin/prohibitin superfamily)